MSSPQRLLLFTCLLRVLHESLMSYSSRYYLVFIIIAFCIVFVNVISQQPIGKELFSFSFFSLSLAHTHTHVYAQTMCSRKRAVAVHLLTAADVKTTVPPTTKQRFFLFSRSTVLFSQGSVFFSFKYTEGWKLSFNKTTLAKQGLAGEHLNR